MPAADTQRLADVVVEARVLDGGRPESSGAPITIRLAVERTLRGNVAGREVTMLTSSSSAACGAYLTTGERYRVYGKRQNDGQLWTYQCYANELLGPAALPEPVGSRPAVRERAAIQPVDWAPLVALPAIGGLALGAIVWRRRRQVAG